MEGMTKEEFVDRMMKERFMKKEKASQMSKSFIIDRCMESKYKGRRRK